MYRSLLKGAGGTDNGAIVSNVTGGGGVCLTVTSTPTSSPKGGFMARVSECSNGANQKWRFQTTSGANGSTSLTAEWARSSTQIGTSTASSSRASISTHGNNTDGLALCLSSGSGPIPAPGPSPPSPAPGGTGSLQVWVKELFGGEYAVGLANANANVARVGFNASMFNGSTAALRVLDLWAGATDLGQFNGSFEVDVPAHGLAVYRLANPKSG